MSELEMTCKACGYVTRGPDRPYANDGCPMCGESMKRCIHFNKEESRVIRKIILKSRVATNHLYKSWL